MFFDAMRDMYSPLAEESSRRGLAAEWCGHPLQAIEPEFRENLRYALRSASRVYAEQQALSSSSQGQKAESA